MNKLLYIGEPTLNQCVRIVYAQNETTAIINRMETVLPANSLLLLPEGTRFTTTDEITQLDYEECTLQCYEMYSIAGDENTLTLINMIKHYFALEESQYLARELGQALVCYLSMNHTQYHKPIVEKVIESIESNYNRSEYSLAAFIRSLPFNYDYTRKLFIAQMGVSPHHYMTSLRMTKALNLLQDNGHNLSINKIAVMCGYDEPLYFSRVFKKHNGKSPTHYLKLKKDK